EAETTGSQRQIRRHPGRAPERLWHPSGVRTIIHQCPEVCASLRPPATFLQPSGLFTLHGWSPSHKSSSELGRRPRGLGGDTPLAGGLLGSACSSCARSLIR